MRVTRASLTATFLLLACSERAGPVPVTTLPDATDTLTVPYGDAAEAAWLGGQRWAMVAPQDREVALVDFSTRRITTLGGGAGKAYDQPFSVFRAGDSIFVGDWARRRLTIWALDGTPRGEVPAQNIVRGALPHGRDSAGQWYVELPPAPRRDGGGNRDSAAVVRVAPDFSRVDTVARLSPLDLAEVQSDAGVRLERRLLSGTDRWGELGDGTVWIARVFQNRVDFVRPDGSEVRGRALPDRVLPVTERDREVFLNRFPPELRSTVERLPFAVIKPPFEHAFADPEGRIWLAKSREIGDTVRVNHVVDRRGELVREVHHRGHGRLFAASDQHVLLIEPFEGGLRLMQLTVPPPPPTPQSGDS